MLRYACAVVFTPASLPALKDSFYFKNPDSGTSRLSVVWLWFHHPVSTVHENCHTYIWEAITDCRRLEKL